MFVRSSLTKALGLPVTLALLFAAPLGCGTEPQTTSSSGGQGSGGSGGAGSSSSSAGSTSGSVGSGGAGGNTVVPPTPCDPKLAMCPCILQGECADGTVCAGGICIAPCDFDYQCPGGKICANGGCTPTCAADMTCPDAGFKCAKGVCIPDAQNPQCGSQAPCPDPADVCVGGVCSEACKQNADCIAGEVCDWASGACVNDPSIKTVCSSDPQCAAATPQTCGADGFCHYICDPKGPNMGVTQCKQIDNRYDFCDGGICKTLAEHSPQCTSKQPCPLGQDCISNKCL